METAVAVANSHPHGTPVRGTVQPKQAQIPATAATSAAASGGILSESWKLLSMIFGGSSDGVAIAQNENSVLRICLALGTPKIMQRGLIVTDRKTGKTAKLRSSSSMPVDRIFVSDTGVTIRRITGNEIEVGGRVRFYASKQPVEGVVCHVRGFFPRPICQRAIEVITDQCIRGGIRLMKMKNAENGQKPGDTDSHGEGTPRQGTPRKRDVDKSEQVMMFDLTELVEGVWYCVESFEEVVRIRRIRDNVYYVAFDIRSVITTNRILRATSPAAALVDAERKQSTSSLFENMVDSSPVAPFPLTPRGEEGNSGSAGGRSGAGAHGRATGTPLATRHPLVENIRSVSMKGEISEKMSRPTSTQTDSPMGLENDDMAIVSAFAPPPPAPPPAPAALLGKPKNRKRMRKLRWEILSESDVQSSMWSFLDDMEVDIDVSELESLFSMSPPTKKATTSRSESGESMISDLPTNVLPLQRINNVGILLNQFRGVSNEDVLTALRAMDEVVFTSERIEAIVSMLPRGDEGDLLRSYRGKSENLSLSEQFMIKLLHIPGVQQRACTWLWKVQFSTFVEDISSAISCLLKASEEVQKSQNLPRVLQLVHRIGTVLNNGGDSTGAVGVRIETLTNLAETKTKDGDMNLLHYLKKHLQGQDGVFDLSAEFSSLNDAAQVNLRELTQSVEQLRMGLEAIEKEIEVVSRNFPNDSYVLAMRAFVPGAKSIVGTVEKDFRTARDTFRSAALWLGEKADSASPDSVFSVLVTFLKQFEEVKVTPGTK